jgi:mannosyltransferase OCH1-like enzyme
MKPLVIILMIWSLFIQLLALADTSVIPKRLIFTFKTNMLKTKHPIDLYNNVQNTIHVYSKAWNIPVEEMDIMFIDDPLCLTLIPQVEPRLLEFFQLEPKGSFKADICRVAALYLYGGYYFDVDIQVLKVLQPNPDTDFITSNCGNHQFFQAVMALAPHHLLARATLDSMLDDWYQILSSWNISPAGP